MRARARGSGATVGQMRSLRHCLSAQSWLSVSHRLVQSKEAEPQGESKDSAQAREVEEEKAGVGGGSKAATRALLRLRGALASGDQLASITDFI